MFKMVKLETDEDLMALAVICDHVRKYYIRTYGEAGAPHAFSLAQALLFSGERRAPKETLFVDDAKVEEMVTVNIACWLNVLTRTITYSADGEATNIFHFDADETLCKFLDDHCSRMYAQELEYFAARAQLDLHLRRD